MREAIHARLDELARSTRAKHMYAMNQAMGAVVELHIPTDWEDTDPFQSCQACILEWPCPTILEIAEAIGVRDD